MVFGGKRSWNTTRGKGYHGVCHGKTYTMAYPMESMAYVMESMAYVMEGTMYPMAYAMGYIVPYPWHMPWKPCDRP